MDSMTDRVTEGMATPQYCTKIFLHKTNCASKSWTGMEWIEVLAPVGGHTRVLHTIDWQTALYIDGVAVVAYDWRGGGLIALEVGTYEATMAYKPSRAEKRIIGLATGYTWAEWKAFRRHNLRVWDRVVDVNGQGYRYWGIPRRVQGSFLELGDKERQAAIERAFQPCVGNPPSCFGDRDINTAFCLDMGGCLAKAQGRDR